MAWTRKGLRNSPEHNAKIAAAQRNLSPEQKARKSASIAKALTGVPKSDETKQRMSEAKKGKAKTPEHLAAMKAGQHRRRAREKQLKLDL